MAVLPVGCARAVPEVMPCRTPLHKECGPVAKAAIRNRFSLAVLSDAPIVMVLQTLVAMLTNRGELHGASHSLPGVALIGLFCGRVCKPLGQHLQSSADGQHHAC